MLIKLPPPKLGMTLEEMTTLLFIYYRELDFLLNGNIDNVNLINASPYYTKAESDARYVAI